LAAKGLVLLGEENDVKNNNNNFVQYPCSTTLYQIIVFITIARHAGAENESPQLVDFPCRVIELEI
jgi:hypothetical protein